MKNTMMIYHANCPDGFGAAYSFWKKYGYDIEYVPVKHGDDIPDVDGKNVYMGDFCFPPEKMKIMLERAKKVTVIDHHITAAEAMENFDHPKLTKYFVIGQSGAALCWKYLNPGEDLPIMIKYIQDRDVGRWELPNGKALLAVLDSNEMSFESWDEFSADVETRRGFKRIVSSGKIILDFIRENTNVIKENIFMLNIRDVIFPTVNTAVFWRSDILTEIAKENDGCSAGFHYDGEKFVFSLRSTSESGIDVSKIAKSFPGGGGHENAAGFSISSLRDLKKNSE